MTRLQGKKIGTLVLIGVLLALLVGLFLFIHHRMRYAVTNAVFVETENLVYVSFTRVAGRILKTLKKEGERVSQGEELALLDQKPYQQALAAAQAELLALKHQQEALKLEIKRLEEEIALKLDQTRRQLEEIEARRAAISARRAGLDAEIAQLRRDKARLAYLFRQDLVPKRKLEGVETSLARLEKERKALTFEEKALAKARAALKKNLALLFNQQKLVAEKKKELASLGAREKALQARVETASLELSYCRLTSPISGYVAKRFHVAGDVVGPGEPVYALVDPKSLYILVLLEETKLRGVQPGAPAKIKIDAFPKEKFEGRVEEILPATAAKFALVPRDVSAGEFTKVAQRVPIKIRITKGPVELLRVGLGGEVEIKRR